MVCFLWALTFAKCHKFLLCGPSFKLEFTKQVQGFLGYRKDKRVGKRKKNQYVHLTLTFLIIMVMNALDVMGNLNIVRYT